MQYQKILTLFLLPALAHAHNLVDVQKLFPTVAFDIRYATSNNFLKKKIYDRPGCYLHADAAQALKAVVDELAQEGLGIKIFDAYHPVSMQCLLLGNCSEADLSKRRDKHTRGTAVDLTLIRLSDQSELEMPTEFDAVDEKTSAHYTNVPAHVLANRTKLQTVMLKHGFELSASEWWHFDLKGYAEYPSLDIPLNELS